MDNSKITVLWKVSAMHLKTDRRKFFRTSAGLLAAALAPGIWSCRRPAAARKKYDFTPYAPGGTRVPVVKVTPDDGSYVHTYYDVCSLSPSQRYLAATRLPYQDHIPALGDGDKADVCVIDLEEQTIETVYSTRSWGFQVGANLQWGSTDRCLYTNDVVGDTAVCVQVDLETDEATAFSGPMYHIAPDESCVIGFPLELLNVTQQGYGVPSRDPANPRRLPPGAAADQGVWRTDLKTGEKSLLLSLAAVAEKIPEPAPRKNGTFYFWHSKFNRQGTRIMQVLRCLFPDGWGVRNAMVFTCAADGGDIRYTPSKPVWGQMGGHPNWHPDGIHLIRNLKPDGENERFCKIRYDGSEVAVLSEKFKGGGHPTVDPATRFCITDDFPFDGVQQVSIRLIDLAAQEEEIICTMPTLEREGLKHPALRLDGHPFWSRDYRKVCFQAAPAGKRQLFIADLSGIVA
ncbi:MAG: hypothetical protein JXQ83_03320 [Candidatus Glassbacteria bacterium]|nr:hypothetical protein [Candidatus Glassbacteria bacterium]